MNSESIFFGIKAICFDFDGVFTDNLVWVGAGGEEYVVCSKSDSLAISLFRHFMFENNIHLRLLIISRESSEVVPARARKLGLECHYGVYDKASYLQSECNLSNGDFIYFGNDQNDYQAMQNASYSLAPSDSDKLILGVAKYVSTCRGGRGFIRDGLDHLMRLHDKKM